MNDSPYTFFEKLEIAESIFSEDEDSTPNDDYERGFQNSVFGYSLQFLCTRYEDDFEAYNEEEEEE